MTKSSAWGGKDFPVIAAHGQHASWEEDGLYDYTAGYGMDGDSHPGVDVQMPVGTTLYALADGVIDYIRNENYPAGTREVVIRTAEGHRHLYTHTSAQLVKAGDRVTAGQAIARSGDPTGLPHLHFEHRVPDASQREKWRIIDPMPLLTAQEAGTTTYTPMSSIVGTILGTPEAWIEWARKNGVQRLDEFEAYVRELYRLAALREGKGPQPHKLITQMLHETGGGTSEAWVKCLNPAGIGVTSDAMRLWFTFRDGVHAARAHYYHASEYSDYPVAPEIAVYRSEDPRAGALPEKFRGTRQTLESYGTDDSVTNPSWAVDIKYGELWAGWLNRLAPVFAGITPDPQPQPDEPNPGDGTGGPTNGGTDMVVRFEKRIATRRLGETAYLRDANAHFTIHENGNAASSPFDEAAFVQNGGGSGGVLYHFTVGVENGEPIIVQIYPADRRGKHAGNAEGNATSLAVETCQAPPGALSDMTQAALRQLLYMVYTKDPRIDWGDRGDRYTFSPDRTRGHMGWPGANPGCPQFMKARWGGVKPVIDAVRPLLVNPGGKFTAGDFVKATEALNIREAPGTGGTLITTLEPGTVGEVIGGPVAANGYTWMDLKVESFGTGWVADTWLEKTEAPEAQPPSEPVLDYPSGMDREIAARLFGKMTVNSTVYQFDERGPVSNLWLSRGKASGQYPQLQEVFSTSEATYFVFSDGSVVMDPAGAPVAQYIGTVEILTGVIKDVLDAA